MKHLVYYLRLICCVLIIIINGCGDAQHKKNLNYIDGGALYSDKGEVYAILRIAKRIKSNSYMSSLRASDVFKGFHIFKLKEDGLVNCFSSNVNKAYWIDDLPLKLRVINGSTYLRSGGDNIYNVDINSKFIEKVNLKEKNLNKSVLEWINRINRLDAPYRKEQNVLVKLNGKEIARTIKENSCFCNLNLFINGNKYMMENARLLWYGSSKKTVWLLFLSNLENFQGFTLFSYKDGDLQISKLPYLNNFPPDYNSSFYIRNYDDTLTISYCDNNILSIIITINGKMEKVLDAKYDSENNVFNNLLIDKKHLAYLLNLIRMDAGQDEVH